MTHAPLLLPAPQEEEVVRVAVARARAARTATASGLRQFYSSLGVKPEHVKVALEAGGGGLLGLAI